MLPPRTERPAVPVFLPVASRISSPLSGRTPTNRTARGPADAPAPVKGSFSLSRFFHLFQSDSKTCGFFRPCLCSRAGPGFNEKSPLSGSAKAGSATIESAVLFMFSVSTLFRQNVFLYTALLFLPRSLNIIQPLPLPLKILSRIERLHESLIPIPA